jgi:hypothetical protein
MCVFNLHYLGDYTRAVWKVRGLTLLFRVGTLWRCGDGLFFEVPPLASEALLTTLHPLLENVLQTVCRKLQDDSGAGGFDLGATFSWLEKPRNRMGRDLDCRTDVLMGIHRFRRAHPLHTFELRNADAPLRLPRHPKRGSFKTTVTTFSVSWWSVIRNASLAKGGTSKKRPSPHLHKVRKQLFVAIQFRIFCLPASSLNTLKHAKL